MLPYSIHVIATGQRRQRGSAWQPASSLPRCCEVRDGCWSPDGFDQSTVRGQRLETYRGVCREQERTGHMYNCTTPAGRSLSNKMQCTHEMCLNFYAYVEVSVQCTFEINLITRIVGVYPQNDLINRSYWTPGGHERYCNLSQC